MWLTVRDHRGMATRPAAGGGHWVDVAPERLEGWLARFRERHGDVAWEAGTETVVVTAADGAVAECHVPFPPLRGEPVTSQPGEPTPPPPGEAATPYGGLLAHVLADRRVGVLLVRLGGHAAGVFEGSRLVSSKVGSRQVHGRSAAGGWSQQRFARRREGQARVALAAAADVAAAVLLPEAGRLDGLVLGGDRRVVGSVLDDHRLAPLRPLVTGPPLDVPDPRRKVLEQTPGQFRAVRVRVVDPTGGATG